MTTFCFRRFERFNLTGKDLKAHLRTRYNLSQNLASMRLAQHDCLQIKTISISSEKFILWLFHCLNNWIVSCFNHSKIWQAFILLLSYCILLQREYFMESKEFTHKLLMYQKSHSFAPLTRSISDTKTTSAGILYKALHSTASYPCHNPRPYSTYHNIPNFTQGTYPWSSPPPESPTCFKVRHQQKCHVISTKRPRWPQKWYDFTTHLVISRRKTMITLHLLAK